jgi:hypothetical protein
MSFRHTLNIITKSKLNNIRPYFSKYIAGSCIATGIAFEGFTFYDAYTCKEIKTKKDDMTGNVCLLSTHLSFYHL